MKLTALLHQKSSQLMVLYNRLTQMTAVFTADQMTTARAVLFKSLLCALNCFLILIKFIGL
ncbi:hypothetical protein DXT99_19290 [Pontibacter diazotrophicus]|uniref:Uncharacterized protein n=1 Tax=Pontibacter diazotrophicus TaxID=1400979 RepID=A0A3D8L808_9BACT|nr:hypothetical protein DXT99_19290 [Pontibacter diazotrophicus]